MKTQTCVVCCEPAIFWNGHIHAAGGEVLFAGWCRDYIEKGGHPAAYDYMTGAKTGCSYGENSRGFGCCGYWE
jgi:hypothetical protein